jgi:hypothetical protein
MFSQELKELLVQVITSWQVLAVTGVLILYVFLVNYVSRLYRRGRSIPMPTPTAGKAKKVAASSDNAPEQTDDDLGLEEKKEK